MEGLAKDIDQDTQCETPRESRKMISEEIKKRKYGILNTVEYYSAIKKN